MPHNNYPEEFEQYWQRNEHWLVNVAPPLLRDERKNNGKMNTTGDWLLFIVPLFVGVGFMNTQIIKNEMLNLVAGLVVVALCFVLAMFVRPYVTGKRNVTEIDSDIKAYFFGVYQENGLKGLEQMKV